MFSVEKCFNVNLMSILNYLQKAHIIRTKIIYKLNT